MDQNVYESKWANLPTEADLAAEAMPTSHKSAKKGWTRKRKMAVAGVAAAAVLIPASAWAAVAIFGFGSFTQAAETTAGTLTISGTPHLTAKILPGSKVGLVTTIQNPTDAAVSVTGIIVDTDPSTFTVTPAAGCHLTLVSGGTTDSIPAHGAITTTHAGQRYAPDHAISIPAGGSETVTFPNIFQQAASDTVLCGVSGQYAIRGGIGS